MPWADIAALCDSPTATLSGGGKQRVALIPTLTHAGASVEMTWHDRDLIGLPRLRRIKPREVRQEMRWTGRQVCSTHGVALGASALSALAGGDVSRGVRSIVAVARNRP